MAEDEKQRIERKVTQVQRRYEGHSKIFRLLWIVGGATIVLAGLAMTVFPGPAIVVIPLGLAMLAAEFTWARRLLKISIDRGVDIKDRLDHTSPKVKALAGAAVACVVAAVAAFLLLS